LPWIGVIGLGYAMGPWFGKMADAGVRQRALLMGGIVGLAGFLALRFLNGYGEKPWSAGESSMQTLMGFFNITKDPPSLLFLALTLSSGWLLHLYALKVLYLMAVALFGLNQGNWFGFSSIGAVWLAAVVLAIALYRPVKAFAGLKARRRDIAWLKYL